MKKIATWARRLVLSLACACLASSAALDKALARGGEGDWPFFCSLEGFDDYDAFQLNEDPQFASGYGIYLFRNNQPELYFEADVWDADDNSYFNVLAADTIGPFRDRRVFAQIAKDQASQSMSSY